MVCSKCGLVISDKIQDTRQEWRDFLNTEEARDRRRTGMPTFFSFIFWDRFYIFLVPICSEFYCGRENTFAKLY
ncbi:MAG: hypothetical protein M3P08_12550 [Thermoproteota archaeon]|nr:hypothetical protein [Thermoproteota archaeon]